MARSLTLSNSSSNDSEARRKSKTTVAEDSNNGDGNSHAPIGCAVNETLCCEARNSLQVILSGAEILLDDHIGNLLGGQKELLIKMIDNIHHLCRLLARLSGPEEFKLAEGEERFRAPRRAPAKA
jgi:hypothetical protein